MSTVPTPSVNKDRPVGQNTVGTVPSTAAKVTVEEFGYGPYRKTVFTFTAQPVTVANTTGASFGSLKICDLPEGVIHFHGMAGKFTEISWVGTGIGTGGSGDYSFGTTATADATLSTTDVNLLPSTAMLDPFVAGVGSSNVGSYLLAAAKIDGSSTAVDVYLNVIIDDADVADADSSIALFTGTFTLNWHIDGDY